MIRIRSLHNRYVPVPNSRLRPTRRTGDAQIPTGDKEATTAATLTPQVVFDCYGARIFNLARRMVENVADAEDITQNVFLQLVRKLDTFRGEAEFTTWLHRLVVNAVRLYQRSEAPRRTHECSASLDNFLTATSARPALHARSPLPEKPLLDDEARALITNAVAGLPEIYRRVFILSKFEERSNSEICAMTRLSLPAVKSRLHRARLLLREALTPHFSDSGGPG